MNIDHVYQLVGYLASTLIAASMVMNSLLRLRIINLAGAATMTVYGVLIQAYPITVLNSFIVLVDCFYLFRIFRKEEFFSLLEVKPGAAYLHYFIDYNLPDIHRFLPDFQYHPEDNLYAFFVLRDTVPAGLMITRPADGGEAWVVLDYVAPGYRDFKVGHFVFRANAAVFRTRGVKRLYSEPGTEAHRGYLRRMGFAPTSLAEGGDAFVLDLDPVAG